MKTFGSLGKVLALSAALGAAVPHFTPSIAHAAEDEVSLEMARQRFQEGVRFYDQKQYDRARAAFLQAYALKKHPAVLLNLALSELRLGHDAAAAEHFSAFLRESKDATPQQQQDAQEGLATAKQKVVEIEVSVDESGAEVYVNGDPKGRSPLAGPIYAKPGEYTIEARKDGRTASKTITGAAGESVSAPVRFASPDTPLTAPAGGGDSGMFEFDSAGKPVRDAGPGGDRQSFLSWMAESPIAWIGGGLTVLGLGAGVTFAVISKKNYDGANSAANQIFKAAGEDGIPTRGLCDSPDELPNLSEQRRSQYIEACQNYQDDVDAGDTMKSAATVSFIVAGAAALATVGLYFVTADREKPVARTHRTSEVSARIVPIAGDGFGGLTLIGQF
jgi:hypothetical protein